MPKVSVVIQKGIDAFNMGKSILECPFDPVPIENQFVDAYENGIFIGRRRCEIDFCNVWRTGWWLGEMLKQRTVQAV